MDIYINCGSEQICLPVLPEGYEIACAANHETVNISTLGDIILKGTPGVKTITLTSFFPAEKRPSGYITRGKFRDPFELVELLEGFLKNASVVRLIITETNINFEFLITDFSYGQSGASGDVNYSLSLSHYKRPNVTQESVINAKSTKMHLSNQRGASVSAQKTYTVKSGDTLKSIAKKFTGSSSNFKAIAQKNSIAAPYKIKVGDILVL